MPRIRVVEGAGAGETVELRPGETLEVGRSRDRTGRTESARAIVLDDPKVSRLHLRIREEGGSWVVEDCESSNGTFVNGRRVETRRIAPGDRIRAGDAVLEFEDAEVAEGEIAEAPVEEDGEGAPSAERRLRRPRLVAAAAACAIGLAAVLCAVWLRSSGSPDSPGAVRESPPTREPPPARDLAPRGARGKPDARAGPKLAISPRGTDDLSKSVSRHLEGKDYRGALDLLERSAGDRSGAETGRERARVLEAVRSEVGRVRAEVERLLAGGGLDEARELVLDLLQRIPEESEEDAEPILRLLEGAGVSFLAAEREAGEAPERELASAIEGILGRARGLAADGALDAGGAEALSREIEDLVRARRFERAYLRRRSDLKAAYVALKVRLDREARREGAFRASEVSWRGSAVALRYGFRSDRELEDFEPLEGSELRRDARGLRLSGECRLFRGEPFQGRIAVRLAVPEGGYEPGSPSLGIALFTSEADRVRPPSAKPRSLLAPAARSGPPPGDFAVFLLGYRAAIYEYGGRTFEDLPIDGSPDPIPLPAHVLLAGARGAPLHSDPREGLWAAPLRAPLRGALRVEVEVSESRVRWTFGGRDLLPAGCEPCGRASGAASKPGAVSLLAAGRPVVIESLEVEGSVREEWLSRGAREAAEAAFAALERSAEGRSPPREGR